MRWGADGGGSCCTVGRKGHEEERWELERSEQEPESKVLVTIEMARIIVQREGRKEVSE